MANESPTEQPTAGELPVVTRGARVSAFLGLERNIVVVSGAMFLMGHGEQLWKQFMPRG